MSDTDENQITGLDDDDREPDVLISGPDDGTDIVTDPAGPITRICHAYRIDFEDCTSREYVAPNDIAAICLASLDKPDVERVQIARIRKNVTVTMDVEEDI